ncbi:MAG: tetratricopeptide (TPR) repeat protein [Acidimicrobiales bacterium]|jgi:tetratricopeptide (TPR) repeat protein
MQEQFKAVAQQQVVDKVEVSLRTIAQNSIVVVFGLLPLFFIPVLFAPFGYSKTLLIIVGVLVSCIFFSLSVLRSGSVRISAPWALTAFWGVAIVTSISALLSGDMFDSFIGETVGVQTAMFTILLAVTMSISSLFGQTKTTIMRLYILLTGSALVLGVFHLLRILFGADFMTFGVFISTTSTPLGGWNDLGLFFGLSILLSLVALEQLPLTKWGKILFSVVVGTSLLMLSVVNFFAIWIVLALVSLVQLMYTLTKERFTEQTLQIQGKEDVSMYSVTLSTAVLVVSLLFIIGGSAVGGFVSNVTGVSYVEVRPSLEATVDIARSVYRENAFLGTGPNKFVDAWRLYKDPAINQTIFWATDFGSGHGYISTAFVTGGIFTIIAWFTFFGLFLMAGFRMLMRAVHVDRFWYFIGTSSFVAAVYLWGMSFIYNPGPVALLLAAVFTSIMFVAHGMLLATSERRFSITSNKRAGFILVGVVMLIIVASASTLYYTGRHYASVYSFSGAVSNLGGEKTLKEVEQSIVDAYTVSSNDLYVRQFANYQLSKMNSLMNLAEATPEQQQLFESSAANGVNAAQLAKDSDPTDPQNWTTLGGVYSILAAAGVEGAKDRASEAFANARALDPVNPTYSLLEGQLASRTGDTEGARASAIAAIQLKQNYTDALVFLSQLDIAEGKVEDAIVTTRAIISFEPKNPARYYQLGILESAAGNLENTIAAFEYAVLLDKNYANARYFLARAYIQNGNTGGALEQLNVVRDLNPENQEIAELISQLESGTTFETPPPVAQLPIEEPQAVSATDDAITTTEDPTDIPQVSTVNTVAGESDDEASEETAVDETVN